MKATSNLLASALVGTMLGAAGAARAEMTAEELAKLAQNPVGNLVSVPFQNNTNYNTGPLSSTRNRIAFRAAGPRGSGS